MLYNKITECRICGSKKLVEVLNLGEQALTGMFPKKDEIVETGPLELVKCYGENNSESCGLVQLKHNYDMSALYGENYGYRSGLNQSMVKHLEGIVRKVEDRVALKDDDLVIDIASNDGTLLGAYRNHKLRLVGIDPTAKKFKKYYQDHVSFVPDFFSSKIVVEKLKQKARVVTSIAMFYDLENPTDFMKQISEILTDDGIWVLEQSYMPKMIDNVSYDTVCHEHLEYYALKQINWMTRKTGLKIIDVEFNDANGASFRVTVAKKDSQYAESTFVTRILEEEIKRGFDEIKIYKEFAKNVSQYRKDLIELIRDLNSKSKKVYGYGASTKGNVILQYCGFSSKDLPFIAEVNEYKFGKFTPGTLIPIISESEVKKLGPDYLLVLPWHFKSNILSREKEYLASGGHFIFPLPKITIV